MIEKRKKLEEFISNYYKLTQQEDTLLFIQKGLEEKKDIGLEANLTIKGKTFSLHELLDGSTEQICQSFEEDLSLFILYLQKLNNLKMEELIDSISIGMTETSESPSVKEELIEKKVGMEKTNNQPSTVNPIDLIQRYIAFNIKKDSIINPSELLDNLPENLKEQIALSDIHDCCRKYVEENKMQILHNATCYKCNAGYEQDYEKLPRDVTCGHCGDDIVNIEIRYKKLG